VRSVSTAPPAGLQATSRPDQRAAAQVSGYFAGNSDSVHTNSATTSNKSCRVLALSMGGACRTGAHPPPVAPGRATANCVWGTACDPIEKMSQTPAWQLSCPCTPHRQGTAGAATRSAVRSRTTVSNQPWADPYIQEITRTFVVTRSSGSALTHGTPHQ